MKLLKPGKPAEVYRKTCPYCGAEFAYTIRETHYDLAFETLELLVTCPWCEEDIKHEDEKEAK